MKVVKFCLFPVFLFLTAITVLGYLAPEGWDVNVSTEINARPETIYPFVDELSRWQEWIELTEAGNDKFTFTYEGPARGVGAVGKSVGAGSDVRWEITASDPQRGIWFDELLHGEAQAKGAIMWEVVGNITKVTWVDRGTLGSFPIKRYFHPLMDKSLNDAYTRNLAGLKRVAEAIEKGAKKSGE